MLTWFYEALFLEAAESETVMLLFKFLKRQKLSSGRERNSSGSVEWRVSYSSMRRLKDRPAGVAHWLNTGASCFSKSEWARTRDIDEVTTNTSTSVLFLKKGSSTIRMTHPGSLYTMHAYELSSRLGEIGSQGKRLRNPLTNYPGESVVLQRLRGRQEAHLCKMSTLRQWFLHHTYDTRSDAGSHSQQDKTYQTVFWIYGLILVANAYVGMHG